jgi:hypothetical protein
MFPYFLNIFKKVKCLNFYSQEFDMKREAVIIFKVLNCETINLLKKN